MIMRIKKFLDKIQKECPYIEDLRISFHTSSGNLIIRTSCVYNDIPYIIEQKCTKKDMATIDSISLSLFIEDTIMMRIIARIAYDPHHMS